MQSKKVPLAWMVRAIPRKHFDTSGKSPVHPHGHFDSCPPKPALGLQACKSTSRRHSSELCWNCRTSAPAVTRKRSPDGATESAQSAARWRNPGLAPRWIPRFRLIGRAFARPVGSIRATAPQKLQDRHCEERLRRSNPAFFSVSQSWIRCATDGGLRCANPPLRARATPSLHNTKMPNVISSKIRQFLAY
jgi:hypothetical protein